jgi:hypothetical protein
VLGVVGITPFYGTGIPVPRPIVSTGIPVLPYFRTDIPVLLLNIIIQYRHSSLSCNITGIPVLLNISTGIPVLRFPGTFPVFHQQAGGLKNSRGT